MKTYGLFGNIIKNNFQKIVFENNFKDSYLMFDRAKYVWELKMFQLDLCVSKYFLKIIFIHISSFSIILHFQSFFIFI